MRSFVAASIALAELLFGSAGVASADDASFLDRLPPRTYGELVASDAKRVEFGHQMCAMLRSGMAPEAIAASWGRPWVDAAQQELCPDTL